MCRKNLLLRKPSSRGPQRVVKCKCGPVRSARGGVFSVYRLPLGFGGVALGFYRVLRGICRVVFAFYRMAFVFCGALREFFQALSEADKGCSYRARTQKARANVCGL